MVIFPEAPRGGRTEIKVRAAALATFLATLAGGVGLELAGDWVKHFPPIIGVPASAAVLAAVTWISARQAKSKPEYLSPSTITAAQAWLRQRMTR